MILFPKKYKYSKSFSGKKISKKNKITKSNPNFSHFCLIAEQSTYISNFQIEALKNCFKKYLKKNSQMFFRIYPNIPITKKPNETRLGCGKGNLKYWATIINKGDIILEINCSKRAKKIKTLVENSKVKLPVKSFIFNKHFRWIF